LAQVFLNSTLPETLLGMERLEVPPVSKSPIELNHRLG
jgi:hypothetical protein